jgi:hypothetical protein
MPKRILQRAVLLWFSTLAIALQAQPPQEHWTLTQSDPIATYYLDKASSRRQGEFLMYWILVAYNYDAQFDGARPYRSARILRYAQCETRRQDTKSFFQYGGPMGQGELVWASTIEEDTLRMEPVEPESVEAMLFDKACSNQD